MTHKQWDPLVPRSNPLVLLSPTSDKTRNLLLPVKTSVPVLMARMERVSYAREIWIHGCTPRSLCLIGSRIPSPFGPATVRKLLFPLYLLSHETCLQYYTCLLAYTIHIAIGSGGTLIGVRVHFLLFRGLRNGRRITFPILLLCTTMDTSTPKGASSSLPALEPLVPHALGTPANTQCFHLLAMLRPRRSVSSLELCEGVATCFPS